MFTKQYPLQLTQHTISNETHRSSFFSRFEKKIAFDYVWYFISSTIRWEILKVVHGLCSCVFNSIIDFIFDGRWKKSILNIDEILKDFTTYFRYKMALFSLKKKQIIFWLKTLTKRTITSTSPNNSFNLQLLFLEHSILNSDFTKCVQPIHVREEKKRKNNCRLLVW